MHFFYGFVFLTNWRPLKKKWGKFLLNLFIANDKRKMHAQEILHVELFKQKNSRHFSSFVLRFTFEENTIFLDKDILRLLSSVHDKRKKMAANKERERKQKSNLNFVYWIHIRNGFKLHVLFFCSTNQHDKWHFLFHSIKMLIYFAFIQFWFIRFAL